MDYSKAVKEYREREFLTQADLALLLGVSFTAVNRWESGKFEPTMKTRKKLEELFKKAAPGK